MTFDAIVKSLALPEHEGTISTYVKKSTTPLTTDVNGTSKVIVNTVGTLQTMMEEASEAAIASADAEMYNAAANLARTIFAGLKMLKEDKPKGGKVVNNHVHVNSFDQLVNSRRTINGN
jgi:hypothetical protein